MQVDIVTSFIALVGLIAGVYWSSRPANKNIKEEDVI